MTGGPTEHFRDGELRLQARMARESREASPYSNQQMWEKICRLNIQETKAESRPNIKTANREGPGDASADKKGEQHRL